MDTRGQFQAPGDLRWGKSSRYHRIRGSAGPQSVESGEDKNPHKTKHDSSAG